MYSVTRNLAAAIVLAGFLAACSDSSSTSPTAPAGASFAKGIPGGGGGGTVQAGSFAGNWSGTITTSFGTGAFTMGLSQSGSIVSGSAHFGAPIFDATLRLAGSVVSAGQLTATVSNGEGSLPLTGTMSLDGTTITGTVIEIGQTFTYVVTRN